MGFIQAINANNSESSKQATAQQKKSSLRDPIVWATVGIFVATAVNVGVGIAQWNALSNTDKATRDLAAAALKQAEAANKQVTAMQGQLAEIKNQRLLTIAQMRANLRRDNPTITAVGEGHKFIGVGEKLIGWEISPNWKNAGSTDAKNFLGWFDIRAFDVKPPKTVGIADCPTPTPPNPLPDKTTI